VAFESTSADLVPGDTNGATDVFVKDLSTGAIRRVSTSSSGQESNGESYSPSISADGRYVAFESFASNLVPNDTNGATDIFVKDMLTGALIRVSIAASGAEANGESYCSSISADGRYVAFESFASNLVPDDTNSATDVFVADLGTGVLRRASVSASGAQSDEDSYRAHLSSDGSSVAFESRADNLVPGDTNGAMDIFVKSLATGAIQRVSVSSSGQQSDGESHSPTLSADGRYVAFESFGTNLVPGDTNGVTDIFVCDRSTGTLTRVSTTQAGDEPNLDCYAPSLSADGRLVAFESTASNLFPGDTNSVSDAIVKDLSTGLMQCVSLSSVGGPANGDCFLPVLSADGCYVAFESAATNLVPGDLNGHQDVFQVAISTSMRPQVSATASRVETDAAGPVPPDGVSTAGIIVTVKDPAGQPVMGLSVALVATGDGVALTQPATTDASGVARGRIAATIAGIKRVTAQVTAAGSSVTLATQAVVSFSAAPTAQSLSLAATAGVALPITLSATDAGGLPLSYTVTQAPLHGTLSGTAPNLVYTASASYGGVDSLRFVASNGSTQSAPATVSLTVAAVVRGDVSGDGRITLADAILALRIYVLGTAPPTPAGLVAADANGDGRVTLADAILILRKCVLGVDLPS
jgi:Tol biopolymer transport system component